MSQPALKIAAPSDPPTLSQAAVDAIEQESRRLHVAFVSRTAAMEVLTAEDLRVLVK